MKRMLKEAANCVLGRPSSSGRLTDSAARTNVALLIRRAVRSCNVDIARLRASFLRPCHGEKHVLARLGRAGEKTAFLSILASNICLLVVTAIYFALLACAGPTLDEQKAQILNNKITFKGLTMQAFLDTWGKPTYQHRELTMFYLMDDGNSIPRFRVQMGEAPEGWTEGAMAAEGMFFGYADRGELLGFVDDRLVYRQQVPAEEIHAVGKQWAHEQRFKTRLETPAPTKPVPPPK